MLTLLTFKPALGVLSPSSFCLKSDALLALSGLPYTRKAANPMKAPRGKLPVLLDGDRTICDSEAIAAHLRIAHGFDPDLDLDRLQRAEAEAYRAMVEEHLYFIGHWSRWVARPEETRAVFFREVPAPVRQVLFPVIRRRMIRNLEGQGTGRRDERELLALFETGMGALAVRLGAAPFFFGPKPRAIDTALFGFLENAIAVELDGPFEQVARRHDNLRAYCDRMRARCFPDGW
jgi:glutathione S-transferase